MKKKANNEQRKKGSPCPTHLYLFVPKMLWLFKSYRWKSCSLLANIEIFSAGVKLRSANRRTTSVFSSNSIPCDINESISIK